MNTLTKKRTNHPKIVFTIFMSVMIIPFVLAWYLVQQGQMQNFKSTNHGHLISPLKNIHSLHLYDINNKNTFSGKSLEGKWWFIYVGPEKCQQTCHDALYNLRQIQTALGKNTSRVERLFIAHPNCAASVCEQYLSEAYPEMKKARFEPNDFASLFTDISNTHAREMVGEIYIMDPKGNIMMHYSADMEARWILSDIKKLLRASKIG